MNRGDAYALLCRELASWRRRPYAELVALVGQLASERVERVGQEDVTVRVNVWWEDRRKTAVLVEAAADGPSCWMLERLVESVVVRPEDEE